MFKVMERLLERNLRARHKVRICGAALAACCFVAVPTLFAQPSVLQTAAVKTQDAGAAAAPAANFNLLPATFIPISEIHPGMRGVAYTVFEGTQPEPMEVEILGVLKNVTGPRGDIILARLHGSKAEYTGVVAGMSGSPVYIGGKLAGALSFRIGMFSKEPIAGITPIADMMEIQEFDHNVPESAPATLTARNSNGAYGRHPAVNPSSLSRPADFYQVDGGKAEGYAQYLTPIEAPLVFNGFSEEAMKRFAPQFAAAGIVPVMGAGAASDDPQPEAIVPGSAISAILVRGDMNIAATCTVTYADAQRLLACGHPLLQYGMVDMPMTKARVLATLASPYNAFKIVNTTETVGSFVQDRHTGILGRFNRNARMIPVTLSIHGVGASVIPAQQAGDHSAAASPGKALDSQNKSRTFRFEVLNNAKLTPVAIMATVFSALQGLNQYGEDITFGLQGRIRVQGYPDVALQDLYAPGDNLPTSFAIATSLGDRFGRIYGNPYQTPEIHGVELDFQAIPERRSARLESARTDVTEARPGEEIVVEAVLRPYRGERIVRSIPVRIPASTPRGTLHILVSDGETLNRGQLSSAIITHRLELASTIAQLNKEHVNNRLYVSLLENNPQAMVEDKVMPALPLSVMNVMDGMLGSQDMVVTGESAVYESSSAVDYAVTGSRVISLLIK